MLVLKLNHVSKRGPSCLIASIMGGAVTTWLGKVAVVDKAITDAGRIPDCPGGITYLGPVHGLFTGPVWWKSERNVLAYL